MNKICVSSWCDSFKIRDLKRGEFNNYDVCTEDIDEIFEDKKEAIKFYNSIEMEPSISFNADNVYVRSKIMFYANEDGRRIADYNIVEDYDMGLDEFVKNL